MRKSNQINADEELMRSIEINFLMTDVEIFYNRQLIQNFEGFQNAARISRVQNAAAHADFEARKEKLKQETQRQLEENFVKSKLHVHVTLRSLRVLVPDRLQFQHGRFLVLQCKSFSLRQGSQERLRGLLRSNLDEHLAWPVTSDECESYDAELQELRVIYIDRVDLLQKFLYRRAASQSIEQTHSILKFAKNKKG